MSEYTEAMEATCASCYKLRSQNQLIDRVKDTSTLSAERLFHEPDWRRSYILLGFIAKVCIWKLLELRL